MCCVVDLIFLNFNLETLIWIEKLFEKKSTKLWKKLRNQISVHRRSKNWLTSRKIYTAYDQIKDTNKKNKTLNIVI